MPLHNAPKDQIVDPFNKAGKPRAFFQPKRKRRHQKPYVQFDYETYAHMLDEPGLTHTEKRELLEALWHIIAGFVELGFGVHPVQSARQFRKPTYRQSGRACGQSENKSSATAQNLLNSYQSDHGGLYE